MIKIFLHIYEDELLISYIQRYYRINGRAALKHTFNELYGVSKVSIDPFIPTNIGRFCEYRASKYGWDEEKIIFNHTLFNYYTFGMNNQKKQEIIDKMKGVNKNAYKVTHYNEIPLSTYFRYCPECVKEQINIYGQYGLNRVNQVGLVCNKHNRWLVESNLPIKGLLGQYLKLQATIDLEMILNDKLFDRALKISRITEKICKEKIDITTDNLRDLYYIELKKRGLLYPSGQSLRIEEIKNEMINYFSPQLLQFLLKMGNVKANDKFVTHPLNRCYRYVHPLYHILMIAFLDIDNINYSNTKKLEIKPDVKCYCLNPLSVFVKRNWSQNALENGSTLSQKFMTI